MQLIYLLLSFYYGKKNPLFYLIFPIAMVSGYGALIDPRTVIFGVDIFTQSKNVYKDVIVLYLIFINFILRHRVRVPYAKTRPFILMIIYITFLIIYTFTKDGNDYEAMNVMRLFSYMIIGFYLLLAIFMRASLKQFIKFFNALFYTTGILSILYIINSAKIYSIFYKETIYQEVEFGMDVFYRDFSTIPYFSHLLFIIAFTTIIMQSNIFNKNAVYLILLTYPFVLLFSFTRSLMGVVIIEIMIVIIIISIKYPQKIFRRTSIILFFSLIIIFFSMKIIFNSQFGYFSSRVETAKLEGKNENNFAIRMAYHAKAFNILEENDALFIGDGINKKHEKKMGMIGAWEADSTIPFWLIYTGIAGVIVFYYMSIHFWYMSLKEALFNSNPIFISLFSIITFSVFISLITGGYRWGDPLIFFNYVLLLFLSVKLNRKHKKFLLNENKDISDNFTLQLQ